MPLLNRESLETKTRGFFKRRWDLYIKEKNISQKHFSLFYIISQQSSKGSKFLSYSDSFFDFNCDDKIWWVQKKKASERKVQFQRQDL